MKQLSVCADGLVKQEFVLADGLVRQELVAADSLVRQEFLVADGLWRQEFHCVWYGCAGMYGSSFFLVTLCSSFWG